MNRAKRIGLLVSLLLADYACGGANAGPNTGPSQVQFALVQEFVGLGVTPTLTPAPGSGNSYAADTVVSYRFAPTDGTSDVVVTLDSAPAAATGTVTMNRTHVFRAALNTEPGSPVPDFTGQTVDGRVLRLHDYTGKVVVADFSSQDCPGSHTAAPILQSLYDAYHARGLEVITVLVDCPQLHNCPVNRPAAVADLQSWQQTFHLSFFVVSDQSNATQVFNYSEKDRTTGFPTGYVIDRGGVIRARLGSWEGNALKVIVEQLLR